MLNKILFVLACIMMYVFIFIFELYSFHFYQVIFVGSLVFLKSILKRGILAFLLSNSAIIIGVIIKSVIKLISRFLSERVGKFLMYRYARVRNACIAGILSWYLYGEDIINLWQNQSTTRKVYIGIIFGPITLCVLVYIFVIEFVRVYIVKKIAETGLVKFLSRIMPQFLNDIGKKVDTRILRFAQSSEHDKRGKEK